MVKLKEKHSSVRDCDDLKQSPDNENNDDYTFYRESDEEFRKNFRNGVQDVVEGRVYTVEEFKAKLREIGIEI